jgi:hypothetical protein
MSRLIAIKQAVRALNQARFQLICDRYLESQYGGDIQSVGTVDDKEKTRPGKPDGYLQFPDGQYILGEYTTQDNLKEKAFNAKLEEDLKGCLDFEGLGIPAAKINMIVLICNSSIKPRQKEKLNAIATPHGIKVRTVGLDGIANFLFYNGKKIAEDLLQIPIYEAPLLQKHEFLQDYNQKNTSSPLSTKLIGRNRELTELLVTIQNNTITVINGMPGVGKSRIALEVIDRFVATYSQYRPFYLLPKGDSKILDLDELHRDGSYIIFIDDGNMQLENVTNLLNKHVENKSIVFKFIITVRDYAKEHVLTICKDFKTALFSIEALNDSDIEQIISSSDFGLTERNLKTRIVEICAGNPRLAIMAAISVQETRDISLLKDVSNIYDAYFKKQFVENTVFNNPTTFRILGAISYFYTIDMSSEDGKNIISNFNISFDAFFDISQILHHLEVVTIDFNNIVKISDQVLSNYLFYRVFFREGNLPFSLLLNNYFLDQNWHMRESFIPANIAFGEVNVFETKKQEILNTWGRYKNNENETNQFMDVFSRYIPVQLFAHVKKEITKSPVDYSSDFNITKIHPNSSYPNINPIIRWLEYFFSSPDRNKSILSIELALEYVKRNYSFYQFFGYLIQSLQKELAINEQDIHDNFQRQNDVFDYLLKKSDSSLIHCHLFFTIFNKILLSYHYPRAIYEKAGGHNILKPTFFALRSRYWNILTENYPKHKNILDNMLVDYLEQIDYGNSIYFRLDGSHLLNLIEIRLNSDLYQDCYFVHQYSRELKYKAFELKGLSKLTSQFNCYAYELSKLITVDKYSWKELATESTGQNDDVYESRKRKIYDEININDIADFMKIYKAILEIYQYPYRSRFNIQIYMDLLMTSIFSHNPELGFETLEYCLNDGNKTEFRPQRLYSEIFSITGTGYQRMFSIIKSHQFKERENWLQFYFQVLPKEYIKHDTVSELLEFYKESKTGIEIYPGTYNNYLGFEPKIYQKILCILVEKRNIDSQFRYKISYHFFRELGELEEVDLLCYKSAYLHQEEIEKHFDSDSQEFLLLFRIDKKFLNEFLDFIQNREEYIFFGHYKTLSLLWNEPGASQFIYDAMEQVISFNRYDSAGGPGILFFMNLGKEYIETAYEVLKKLIQVHSKEPITVNIILNIARNTLRSHYHQLIADFLEVNVSLEDFEKLYLNNSHFTTSSNEIWSEFKGKELAEIQQLINQLEDPITFILHVEYLDDQISQLEKHTIYEKKMRFQRLYG